MDYPFLSYEISYENFQAENFAKIIFDEGSGALVCSELPKQEERGANDKENPWTYT